MTSLDQQRPGPGEPSLGLPAGTSGIVDAGWWISLAFHWHSRRMRWYSRSGTGPDFPRSIAADRRPGDARSA
jgi:hypothetical protein